ncbi:hypothetical protein EIP91_003053 [Steccherinum ochraceum]|uniref:F-box domain-containing protein n=1 Tax=Steccherinum ochraceum TaxID=92696 RepID=A0A4R0RCN1_9APHY|nr:hypothetical protein EIP91_003053 [Steccherinum ochraceum]
MNADHTHFVDVGVDRSREWLQEEVLALQNHFYALRDLLNGYAPAYTLPAELLLKIFSFVQDSRHRDTMTLTHVCQRWRSVALTSQQLWSYIVPCGSLDWAAECLRRSGSTPIKMRWTRALGKQYHKKRREVNIATIAFCTDCCSVIDLVLSSQQLEIFTAHASFEWTILRQFCLSNSSDNIGRRTVPIQFPQPPPNASSAQAIIYNLRCLSLDAILPNSWAGVGVVGGNLRTLRLRHFSGEPSAFTMTELLSILQNASATLEDLLLVGCEPRSEDGGESLHNPRSQQLVDLPRLQVLCISSANEADLAELFSHLSIPASSHVHIHKTSYTGSSSILSCLPSRRSALMLLDSYRDLRINFCASATYVAAYHPQCIVPDQITSRHKPCFKLILNGRRRPHSEMHARIRQMLFHLGPAFSGGIINDLVITAPLVFVHNLKIEDWREILRPLQRLSSLTFVEDPVLFISKRGPSSSARILDNIVQALYLFSGPAKAPLLPTLSYLEVQFVSVDSNLADEIHALTQVQIGSDFAVLVPAETGFKDSQNGIRFRVGRIL